MVNQNALCASCNGKTKSQGGLNVSDLNKLNKDVRSKPTRKEKIALLKKTGLCTSACNKSKNKKNNSKKSTQKRTNVKKTKKTRQVAKNRSYKTSKTSNQKATKKSTVVKKHIKKPNIIYINVLTKKTKTSPFYFDFWQSEDVKAVILKKFPNQIFTFTFWRKVDPSPDYIILPQHSEIESGTTRLTLKNGATQMTLDEFIKLKTFKKH